MIYMKRTETGEHDFDRPLIAGFSPKPGHGPFIYSSLLHVGDPEAFPSPYRATVIPLTEQ